MNMRRHVSVCTVQGDRVGQEDSFAVQCDDDSEFFNGWLLVVADGFGGREAAKHVCQELPGLWLQTRDRHSTSYTTALLSVVGQLQADVNDMMVGAALSAVYIPKRKNKAYIATIGDAPVVIRQKTGLLVQSRPHNAANPIERMLATKRGAVYDGIRLADSLNGPVVALTRAVGARYFSFLGRVPDTRWVRLGSESYVLMASDGLFNCRTPEAPTLHFDKMVRKGACASDLVRDAVSRGSYSNVTALLWRYRSGS